MEWVIAGEVANVLQLSLSLRLIYTIIQTATNARMHKKNCRQFAQHLRLIASLLEQLKPSDVSDYAEYAGTREPLEHLEQSLKKALVLVENCRDKSYLYLIAMGWSIVAQFKDCQDEIDRYLRLIPLITLVENHRDRLKAIERDRREYTLDDEEKKMFENLLKEDRTKSETAVLKKSLSKSYPGMALENVLRQENLKLRKELERMQALMDIDQCDVIEHLIDITETVDGREDDHEVEPAAVAAPPLMLPAPDAAHILPPPALLHESSGASNQVQPKANGKGPSTRLSSANRRGNGNRSSNAQTYDYKKWHNGLYDCCIDPFLCISTFLYPCGAFTNIASIVSDGEISQELACHDLAFYTLFLSCYCYTCCFRRKLRKRFHIPGGTCDDFWVHTLCCCCAMVQEWREIQACEEDGLKPCKTRVPSQQTMENYRPRPSPNNQDLYMG